MLLSFKGHNHKFCRRLFNELLQRNNSSIEDAHNLLFYLCTEMQSQKFVISRELEVNAHIFSVHVSHLSCF